MSKKQLVKKAKTTPSKALPLHVKQDRVIQRLIQAEEALAFASGIDQVKLVMDVAAAQEVFAKRQSLGEDVIGYAHVIRVRALAKLGELLKELEKHEGGRPSKTPSPKGGVSKATLKELGVTYKVASVAQQLADLPPQTREAIAQREKTLSKVRRENKAQEIRKVITAPEAKYRVIYADPPWSYGDKSDNASRDNPLGGPAGSVQSGGTGRHYESLTIKQLCELPVDAWCEEHAVLFLWVTSPLLFECAPVIKAWGFTYKASFVWDKVKHNMGHYNSVRHEFLLICTRGSCTPDVVELFDSVQSIERTTHSTKPEEFRKIIETLYPHGKRLEMFARQIVDGWDVYGYEANQAAS